MTNVKCVLDIMENKGYIKIEERKVFDCKVFFIKITDTVKDENIRKEMYNKIYQKMKDSKKYIFDDEDTHWNPNYCKKEDINQFIEYFIETQKEEERIHLPKYIRNFIGSHYTEVRIDKRIRNYYIINCNIKKERLEKEEKQDREALDLLNNIL